jgi:hypothetical protein
LRRQWGGKGEAEYDKEREEFNIFALFAGMMPDVAYA